jgi:hypothetical protein
MCLHARWLPVAASTLLLLAACDDRPGAPSPVPASGPPEALAITGISPTDGFAGQPIVVSGTGFVAGAMLTLGGLPAGNPSVSVNIGSVSGTIPPHSGGPVDVVVTNPDGQSATRTGGFNYLTVSLTASPNAVRPGEKVSVSWAAHGRPATLDWIGLFGVGVPNTSYEEGLWQYTHSASGTMTFTAPGSPGDYEFRYLLDDGYLDVARAAVAVR